MAHSKSEYGQRTGVLGVLLCLALAGPAFADCERPLSVGWESWRPYMYKNEEGRLSGLDIELIQAVADRMGCQLEFSETPFKRHLLQLRQGKIDLATSVQKTADREEYAWFSQTYRSSASNLIIRREDAERYHFKSFKEMTQSQFRLGVTRGYFYGNDVNEYIEKDDGKLHVEDVVSDELNLMKLLAKRVDGIFADPIVIYSMAGDIGRKDEIAMHPLGLVSSTFYIMGSKASVSPKTMDNLNQALQDLQQSGEFDAIVNRYLDGG
ncbi:ABC-type amino acid transport/signal transduction systems, periplasmic component/domain [Hahella chejuensis KCTC 2396]|uniref:ABC-type amino acid transport/signal transduction systems, periplasmic component/domain n=1 Tax=Hahella chejuensis (strain KCTC 2396) TaxID=349521 RepID=Q2SQL2_HAHCH|nr:transporter substrate-binding domain-containing protein [Hahella chejuensis]ABC27062.1 ABC-type amino acid transport/signal transduction systems, periplasmic component/domain [Hahella chejuensis KCTC 2396]